MYPELVPDTHSGAYASVAVGSSPTDLVARVSLPKPYHMIGTI